MLAFIPVIIEKPKTRSDLDALIKTGAIVVDRDLAKKSIEEII